MGTLAGVDVDRGRVLLGAVGTAVLATLCGIGGPPSVLRQDLPSWLQFAAVYLLAVYLVGMFVALVGVVVAAAIPRIGRLFATGAAVLTTLGNAMSSVVGDSGEARGALVFSLFLLPFVLVMWVSRTKRTQAL